MDDASLHADLYIARKSCQQMREAVVLARTWDEEWLRRMRKAATTATAAINDEECHALLAAVLGYAEELRSPEAHGRWARPRSMTGGNYLRLQIICKLIAFQGRLSDIEATRSIAEGLAARLGAVPRSD